MRNRLILIPALLILIAAAATAARAESPYIFGIHFFREGANLDMFSGKPGWVVQNEYTDDWTWIDEKLKQYREVAKEGHTQFCRLNTGWGTPSPTDPADNVLYAGECAYYAERLKDYTHLYIFGNEENTNQQWFDSFMAARQAIHAVQPDAFVTLGRPNNAYTAAVGVGEYSDGYCDHNLANALCDIADAATPSGKTKPVYVTECGCCPPNDPMTMRSIFSQMNAWNLSHAHKQEAACRYVYFEFGQEYASALIQPLQNGDFQQGTLGTFVNSYSKSYIVQEDPVVTCTGETTATVSWTTDEPSTAQVEYWVKGSQVQTISDFYDTSLTSHTVTLVDLMPGVEYEFILKNYRSSWPLTISKVYSWRQEVPGSGIITGTVKLPDGTPVHHARVLRNPGNADTYTDENGVYALRGCPPDTYRLTVTEAGIGTAWRYDRVVESGGTNVTNLIASPRANLLDNPGFETGSTADWVGYGSSLQVSSDSQRHTGSYYAKRESSSSSDPSGMFQKQQVVKGAHYYARAYSKVRRGDLPWSHTYSRIGCDLYGGQNPTSTTITWQEPDYPYVKDHMEWRVLETGRFTTPSSFVTVFLDYKEFSSKNTRFHGFDDIGLYAEEPVPTVIDNCVDLKAVPDGVYVSISGRVSTCNGLELDGFYIEDPDRVAGVYVEGFIPELVEGQQVDVKGTMLTRNGERWIYEPTVTLGAVVAPLEPLALTNESVGGADFEYDDATGAGQIGFEGGVGLNTTGLLVRTYGQVVSTDADYFAVSDGSENNLLIESWRLSSVPSVDDRVIVTGISSTYQDGGDLLPMVKPRRDSDVRILP